MTGGIHSEERWAIFQEKLRRVRERAQSGEPPTAPMTDEEARAEGRALRDRMREAGYRV